VTTKKRSEALPEVPTVGDYVPGFEASGWFGVVAPKGTPAEITDKLNTEIFLSRLVTARAPEEDHELIAGHPQPRIRICN
jgi:hypothetical protein